MSGRWARDDFAHDSRELAPRLLGQVLVHVVRGKRRAGRIVEVEAYCGHEDDCSHAYSGVPTDRTRPMFGPPGLAYVYISYGVHRCMNVVCGVEGAASAVLVRALEPLEGIDAMRRARAAGRPRRDTDLCSGPGKLGQAMGIGTARSGEDMVSSPRLWVEHGPRPAGGDVARSARIGMNPAAAWAEEPLRWYDGRSAHVSRRSTR